MKVWGADFQRCYLIKMVQTGRKSRTIGPRSSATQQKLKPSKDNFTFHQVLVISWCVTSLSRGSGLFLFYSNMLIDLRYLSETHFNSILGSSPLKNQSTDLQQSPRSQKQEDQPVQQRATRKRWRWNSGVLGGPASNQNKLVNRSSQPDLPPQPKPRGDPLPRPRNRWLTASTVQARQRERTYFVLLADFDWGTVSVCLSLTTG